MNAKLLAICTEVIKVEPLKERGEPVKPVRPMRDKKNDYQRRPKYNRYFQD